MSDSYWVDLAGRLKKNFRKWIHENGMYLLWATIIICVCILQIVAVQATMLYVIANHPIAATAFTCLIILFLFIGEFLLWLDYSDWQNRKRIEEAKQNRKVVK